MFTIALRESQSAHSIAELTRILDGRASRFFRMMNSAIASADADLRTAEGDDKISLQKIRSGLAAIQDEASSLISNRKEAMKLGDFVRAYELGNEINALSNSFQPLIKESSEYASRIERTLDSLPPGVTSARQAEDLISEYHQRGRYMEAAMTSANSMMPPPSN